MRMIWARRKASPQAGVNRMHFVMLDFLRMFLAAVLCGIAVSVIAAGLALVLAHDAYAATSTGTSPSLAVSNTDVNDESAIATRPYPGMLSITSGCDGESVDAVERDWKVTINGKHIDVRVMQTFVVPAGDASAATFNALLPVGAKLLRLTAYTTGGIWQAKIFDSTAYVELTTMDFRKLARQGILIVQSDDGAIATDAIVNLAEAESVDIEYTYRLNAEESAASHDLTVTLTNDDLLSGQWRNSRAMSGSVWVEWQGRKPARLTNMPAGAALEMQGNGISGLFWTSHQLSSARPFHLAWSM